MIIFYRIPVQTSVCFSLISPSAVQHLLYPPVFPSLDQFRNKHFTGSRLLASCSRTQRFSRELQCRFAPEFDRRICMVIQQHLNCWYIPVPRRKTEGGGTVTSLRVDICTLVAVVAQKRFHRGYVWMRIFRPCRCLHKCSRTTIATDCTARIYIGPLLEQEPNQLRATLACGPEQSRVAELPVDKL
jgi:hypothetical protein